VTERISAAAAAAAMIPDRRRCIQTHPSVLRHRLQSLSARQSAGIGVQLAALNTAVQCSRHSHAVWTATQCPPPTQSLHH